MSLFGASNSSSMETPATESGRDLRPSAERNSWKAPVVSSAMASSLLQLGFASFRSSSEQMALIEVEASPNAGLELKKLHHAIAAKDTINLIPNPLAPELDVSRLAAQLFNHIEGDCKNVDLVISAFIQMRVDRVLDWKKMLAIRDSDPSDKSEISKDDLRQLAIGVAMTPWHIINTPTESYLTTPGSKAILRAKQEMPCIAVHTHPFFTSYPELNEKIKEQKAEWSATKIYDFFESADGKQIVKKLSDSKGIFLDALVKAEQDSRQINLNESELDIGSRKAYDGLIKIAGDKGVDSAEYKKALASQIFEARYSSRTLSDLIGNSDISLEQLHNISKSLQASFQGTFAPSPMDINMARDFGRGRINPTDTSYFDVIVNPIGFIIYQGNSEGIRIWSYSSSGKLLANQVDLEFAKE